MEQENRYRPKYGPPARYADVDLAKIDPKLQEYAKSIKLNGEGRFIFGPVGTGKTFALHAIAKYIVEERGGPARVWNFTDALRDIKDDWDRHWTDKKHTAETLREYKGILMLDDIGAEKATEWVVETLYGIINWRYERRMPIVLTSNVGLDKISEAYGDRIASRIVEMVGGKAGIIHIGGEDRRVK